MLNISTLQAVILSWSQKVGQDLSPPEELKVIGRQLNLSSYRKLLGQISPEEELFGLYDRGTSPKKTPTFWPRPRDESV